MFPHDSGGGPAAADRPPRSSSSFRRPFSLQGLMSSRLQRQPPPPPPPTPLLPLSQQKLMHMRSRFVEGSMSDRASAAPPVSFLGPESAAAFFSPVSPTSPTSPMSPTSPVAPTSASTPDLLQQQRPSYTRQSAHSAMPSFASMGSNSTNSTNSDSSRSSGDSSLSKNSSLSKTSRVSNVSNATSMTSMASMSSMTGRTHASTVSSTSSRRPAGFLTPLWDSVCRLRRGRSSTDSAAPSTPSLLSPASSRPVSPRPSRPATAAQLLHTAFLPSAVTSGGVSVGIGATAAAVPSAPPNSNQPSPESVMANYQHLMETGFFRARAIPATRQGLMRREGRPQTSATFAASAAAAAPDVPERRPSMPSMPSAPPMPTCAPPLPPLPPLPSVSPVPTRTPDEVLAALMKGLAEAKVEVETQEKVEVEQAVESDKDNLRPRTAPGSAAQRGLKRNHTQVGSRTSNDSSASRNSVDCGACRGKDQVSRTVSRGKLIKKLRKTGRLDDDRDKEKEREKEKEGPVERGGLAAMWDMWGDKSRPSSRRSWSTRPSSRRGAGSMTSREAVPDVPTVVLVRPETPEESAPAPEVSVRLVSAPSPSASASPAPSAPMQVDVQRRQSLIKKVTSMNGDLREAYVSGRTVERTTSRASQYDALQRQHTRSQRQASTRRRTPRASPSAKTSVRLSRRRGEAAALSPNVVVHQDAAETSETSEAPAKEEPTTAKPQPCPMSFHYPLRMKVPPLQPSSSQQLQPERRSMDSNSTTKRTRLEQDENVAPYWET